MDEVVKRFIQVFFGWLMTTLFFMFALPLLPIFALLALVREYEYELLLDIGKMFFESDEEYRQRKINECPLKDSHPKV